MLPRPQPAPRMPPQVVAESLGPRMALVNFLIDALEAAGFAVRTADWPEITVLVNDQPYPINVGAGALTPKQAEQVVQQLRGCLAALETS
jgi:hypothetical protein